MAADRFTRSHYATLIVGAGFQGLAYTRTCLRLNPDADLLVLDANKTIGGVWCKERLYPNVHTNNLLGTYQFTDFPTIDAGLESLGVAPGKHIPGTAVHEYLAKFADKEKITSKIRFSCKVLEAQETELNSEHTQCTGWTVEVDVDGERVSLTCNALVLATGTCTKPRDLTIPGQESFGKPCFTIIRLGKEGAKVAEDPNAKHVTVVGTAKSSYDSVYMYATAGKRVTWLIRSSGHGARYMARPYVWLGPFKKWLEGLLMTRPLTWLSPCIYGAEDGYGWLRTLLHWTTVGQWIVRNFFNQISRDKISQAGFNDNPKFKLLIPKHSMLWHATQSGIFNYSTDFLDLIRSDAVEIIEKDIAELQPEGTVVFTDGSRIKTDALVAATGWEVSPGVQLLPESKHADWGVPSKSYSEAQNGVWRRRHVLAEAEVRQRFPILVQQPIGSAATMMDLQKHGSSKSVNSNDGDARAGLLDPKAAPWRLYHAIAPPNQAASSSASRNIVFLSAFYCFQAPLRAEIASLWAWAYLHRQLTRDPAAMGSDKVWHDTALLGQWAAMRHPLGFGPHIPEVMLDALPYFDMLMNDLGLPPRRGLLGDIFGGRYKYEEWAGIIEEWRDLRKVSLDAVRGQEATPVSSVQSDAMASGSSVNGLIGGHANGHPGSHANGTAIRQTNSVLRKVTSRHQAPLDDIARSPPVVPVGA